jgi:lambda repressor-like predicted transcriptional regulator
MGRSFSNLKEQIKQGIDLDRCKTVAPEPRRDAPRRSDKGSAGLCDLQKRDRDDESRVLWGKLHGTGARKLAPGGNFSALATDEARKCAQDRLLNRARNSVGSDRYSRIFVARVRQKWRTLPARARQKIAYPRVTARQMPLWNSASATFTESLESSNWLSSWRGHAAIHANKDLWDRRMTTDIKKNEFLGKLSANLPQYVSLPVLRAIVDQVDPILGVASASYEKYAEASATGLRTVARTIPALHRHGLLGKQIRHDGPPVLWLPEIMDMRADEALRRIAWLAQHKDENPQNYFAAGNGSAAERAHTRRVRERVRDEIEVEGAPKTTNAPDPALRDDMQLALPHPRLAEATCRHGKYPEILNFFHRELDARGLTAEDPRALTKVIHAMGNARLEGFRHLDTRAVRKAYLRARARLPARYDLWIGLVGKWDKSYTRQMARSLVDRLVGALGNRPFDVLDRLFDHLEEQICDHLPKKVVRLEAECERLEQDKFYTPQLRPLRTDAIKQQMYAALENGPKAKSDLARMFGKTIGSISSVGRRLRNDGLITSIWDEDQFKWARVSTTPRFVCARDAIVAALKKGPMTIPALARDTGKGTPTVKSALHRHLLVNGTVIRTKHGIYALVGSEQPYVSKADAIVAALENGPMANRELARETGTSPSSLPQFLDLLRAKGKIIRIKRGVYALPGSARVYVPTCDAIIASLTKKALKLGPLVQHVNKSTKIARTQSSIRTVLARLKKEGTIKQERPGGEYCLARRVR